MLFPSLACVKLVYTNICLKPEMNADCREKATYTKTKPMEDDGALIMLLHLTSEIT